MKLTLLKLSSLFALLTSCAPLGLYSPKHLNRETRLARARGIAEGRAIETQKIRHQREWDLSQPQPKSEYYELPVPAHTNSDGVQIAPHKSLFEFFTD